MLPSIISLYTFESTDAPCPIYLGKAKQNIYKREYHMSKRNYRERLSFMISFTLYWNEEMHLFGSYCNTKSYKTI